MIIGLTGKNGSGKGTVAEFLKSRGFMYYSLSDMIREALKEENIPINRESLITKGNFLREKFGPSVLADRIVSKLDPDKHYVIDSIRNPFEVQRLRQLPRFVMINVEAPIEVRFSRCIKRSREGAEESLESFKKVEEKELQNKDSNAQSLIATAALADFVLDNGGAIEQLHDNITKVLKQCADNFIRPSWDEYFMNIAKVVAQRSNCVKRHVAALIVKDKRVISTGYNGTPRGIKNCYEGGCPRCNSFGASGKDLGECICSHAEENAIVQAAFHGVSIKNSTLYTTFSPCLICTKMIINSGIIEVVYDSEYSMSSLEMNLLKEAGVKVSSIKDKNPKSI